MYAKDGTPSDFVRVVDGSTPAEQGQGAGGRNLRERDDGGTTAVEDVVGTAVNLDGMQPIPVDEYGPDRRDSGFAGSGSSAEDPIDLC